MQAVPTYEKAPQHETADIPNYYSNAGNILAVSER